MSRLPDGDCSIGWACGLGLGLALLCAVPLAHAADGIGGTGVTTRSDAIGGTGVTDGIGGTGITGYGHIERFGSIFVNGREYFLDRRTRVSVDGARSTEQQLHLGDVVQVEARLDPLSGRATAVAVHNMHQVIGIVERVSPSTVSLSVLGQEITLTASTQVQDARNKTALALDQIKPGDAVAVSALAHGDHAWTATRLSRLGTARETAQNTAFRLHGAVTRIDRDNDRIHVGAQSFALDKSQSRTLREGQSVVLRGRYGSDVPRVDKIERERPLGIRGERVEMEGYVRADSTNRTLKSNGITLRVDSAQHEKEEKSTARTTVRGRVERDGSIRVEQMEPKIEGRERPSVERGAAIDDAQKPDLPSAGRGTSQTPKPERTEKDTPAAARRETSRLEIDKPSAQKPDLERPEVEKPAHEKPQRPEVEKPVIEKPEISRPEVERPDVKRPDAERPDRSHVERPERKD